MLDRKKILSFFLFFLAIQMSYHVVGSPCESIEYSQQVAPCARSKKYQSDELLNLSYRAALRRIKDQYGKSPLLADQYVSLLRGAQREWIKLRDADCKLEAFEIEETAEAYQVTIDNCVSRMSDDRAAYLEKIAPNL